MRLEVAAHPPTIGRTAGGDGAIDALGAAQAKFDDGIALGGQADAGGLGGNQGLEIDDVEQSRSTSCA